MDTLDRNQYLTIIEEVRNLEKTSLDSYIDKKLIPLQQQDPNFIKTLYKDILYVLDGVDEPGDNDLVIENGSLAIEDGSLKLSGYQTRLHYLTRWLHMQVVHEMTQTNPLELVERLEAFEANFLGKITYTPGYRAKLDEIKASVVQERQYNYKGKKWKPKKKMSLDEVEVSAGFKIFGIKFRYRKQK